ncbi:acetyl-CoA synthetase-like protein [Lepidopterella palustris CBS 459.81]|uniref:Acetyl-CoA synthetase-like protein n=1 Tax=Lepidopterella palustris CBS 459.81 TaxID=1314670 RepID=A0A8E2E9L1_9PEZI|nr:acetyl-CoA synthetase-like protein [Lepidopterella palustris CBS 459.81]
MVFYSKLPKPAPPSSDVFNFIFHEGRENYPRDRVLYRVDGTDETLTLEELEEKSRRFASVLVKRYAIKPNDVVAFLANNKIEYPIAFFGVLAAGATISPIPVQQGLDARAIVPRLQQSETKLIITDRVLASISKEAADLSGNIPLISLDGATGNGIEDIQQILSEGDSSFDGFELTTSEQLEEYNAFIYRTSGSSGNIKSVLTPHAHWAANLLTTRLTVPEDTDPSKDVWISSLPFAYGINAKLNLGLNILLGIPVIILKEAFDQSSLPLIDKYGITFLFITPPLAAQIAKSEKREGAYQSIKWLLSAGAPVHPKIRDGVQERLNGVKLTLEWGTTETLLIALQIDEESSVPGSSGTLVNGVEAKVLDVETGKELGPGEQGEILVRNSLARFAGYKDNEEANRDFDEEGWFHSGDVGYIDEKSNVFIVDRLKELLRVGDGYGTHVSTGEIEAALFDHPAVATAVVVGIRDQDTQQEHPTAFVVPQPEFKEKQLLPLAEEIEKSVESKLGTFKRVSGGVYFVEKYPQVGYKINKRLLKGLVDVGAADRSQRFISIGA